MMKSSTQTLIKALHILSEDIQSQDGIANVAIAEAAYCLQDLHDENEMLKNALKNIAGMPVCLSNEVDWIALRDIAEKALDKCKEHDYTYEL